jgi:hypothetical protein
VASCPHTGSHLFDCLIELPCMPGFTIQPSSPSPQAGCGWIASLAVCVDAHAVVQKTALSSCTINRSIPDICLLCLHPQTPHQDASFSALLMR